MPVNPLAVAAKGKGYRQLLRRVRSIFGRYGVTSGRMERALFEFAELLTAHRCPATFPITAVALARNPQSVRALGAHNIELAIHGYRHRDHSALSLDEQRDDLRRAREAFTDVGLRPRGFRSPYLRCNQDTLHALRHAGVGYDSSNSIAWDVLTGQLPESYQRVLGFYGALQASDYPALPVLDFGLLRLPYSLPDDEAMVERLGLSAPMMSATWLAILRETYDRGELFVLGLHPERVFECRQPLAAVLTEAALLSPGVWFAGLDEIDAWWRERRRATATFTGDGDGRLRVSIEAPDRAVVLTRGLEVAEGPEPWAGSWQRVRSRDFVIRADRQPVVGVSDQTPEAVADLLRQQGYLVASGVSADVVTCYLDVPQFSPADLRGLLGRVETGAEPLVRLGRWPDGARSALAVTGDVDALTIWDYVLRAFGR